MRCGGTNKNARSIETPFERSVKVLLQASAQVELPLNAA